MRSASLSGSIVGTELENLIRCLQDSSQRDDLKLKALQEIWVSYDVFYSSPAYSAVLESLVKIFLKLLSDTVPQFIAENNTHMLRKQILDILLRTSTHEALKPHVKEITKTLLKLITFDNEENAILAIKIISDIGKNCKMQSIPEVTAVITFCKQIVKDMSYHVNAGMFETRDLASKRMGGQNCLEESLIESYLQHCYHTQQVTLNTKPTGTDTKYNLIPRAQQSVKIIQELTMFFVFLYQHFKNSIVSECLDFLLLCIQFASLTISPEQKASSNFNKILADEFYTSQTKSLCFVSIMGKVPQFMEVIQQNSSTLITGMLCLLENLPSDLVIVRKEVLMTLKFCFSTDLRNKFLPLLPRLLSEDALLGTGFTSVDHLRVFMYQMLADLLHHMRTHLQFPMLLHTTTVFSRTMNDNSITFQVQIMCVRLLNSVCETMTKMEQQGEATRDILLVIMENLILKLKQVSVYHLPLLYKQYGHDMDNKPFDRRDTSTPSTSSSCTSASAAEEKRTRCELLDEALNISRRCSLDKDPKMEVDTNTTQSSRSHSNGTNGTPQQSDSSPAGPSSSSDSGNGGAGVNKPSPPMTTSSVLPAPTKTAGKQSTPEQIMSTLWTINTPSLTLTEARNLVKYVMQTCKFCASQLVNSRRSNASIERAKERDMFENLLKYGIQCMDVYVLPYQQPHSRGSHSASGGGSRSKDEKEALESFATLFTYIGPDVFRELFAKYIDFLVERIHCNMSLQLMVNTFLVRADWSCKFGSIMLKYLMDKMPLLAVSNEKTGLYVKLFKIIFSAIGCSQPQSSTDGELMLKPYLPDLIRKSTEYALSAREPLNYFLLLRALFRSIGGGAHDILYGQFLPLLPNLLQFLNKLQSCQHRQQMRELFLELCLTVPVRLSSLLPYLPLLMDPLVCALNGSTSLVQQGLRTLELCVDNLQPEYLFEHMTPVRGALMQGLWRVLGTSSDMNSAAIAFRILGKFGGANRKMLNEPQQLEPVSDVNLGCSVLRIEFPRSDGSDGAPPAIAELSLSEIMSTAVEQMRLCTTQPEPSIGLVGSLLPIQFVNQSTHPYASLIRQHSMELARGVLLTALGPAGMVDDWKNGVVENLKEQFKRLDSSNLSDEVPLYKCNRANNRKMFSDALTVLFIGVIGKDLRGKYLKFFNAIVRQLTIHSLLECSGRDQLMSASTLPLCLDASILVDSLVTILSDSNKDFLHSAIVALCHVNETCRTLLPNHNMMHHVPMVRHLMDRLCSLCFGPSWFARLGGASALAYVIDNYPTSLVRANLSKLVECLCEIITGMVDEISSGAVDMAISSLTALQKNMLTETSLATSDERLTIFMEHYVVLMFHGSPSVRHKVGSLLDSLVGVMTETNTGDLLRKFSHLFKDGIETIIRDISVMSMSHQSASLSIISNILCVAPSLVSLKEGEERTDRFLRVVLDICETGTHLLSEREFYKVAETCPAHFLPPYPISQQMEVLRSNAIRAAVTCYEVLSAGEVIRTGGKDEPMDTTEKESGDDRKSKVPTEDATPSTSDVNPQPMDDNSLPAGMSATCARILKMALSELGIAGSAESVKTAVEEALLRCVPVPLAALTPLYDELMGRLKDLSQQMIPDDVLRLEQLVRLNPKLFNRESAVTLVTHIKSWRCKVGNGGVSEEELPLRTPEDVEAVHATLRLLCNSQYTDPPLIASLVSFICFFESNYCIDTPLLWLPLICQLLSRWPRESLAFLLSEESLSSFGRANLVRRIIKHENSAMLRMAICQDPLYFQSLLNRLALDPSGSWQSMSPPVDEEMAMQREETVLQLLDCVSRAHVDWFGQAHELVARVRTIWNSDEFRLRYSVHPTSVDPDHRTRIKVQSITGHKYKVPRLFVNCFIRYLRKNRDAYDLLFDVLFVFDNHYATDFCFLKDWLEKEVIPCCSLSWRQQVFNLVLEKFETEPLKWQKNTTMAKIIQYLLIPCLHWAFERYDVEEILGPALPDSDQAEDDPRSMVSRLATMLDVHRQALGDKNVIVFYQLCTLLVEFAPQHIHNNACKKQGGRLRVFMLFAWPCLTPNSHSDPTLRFTGFLFLSNIIDKFTINRKIVLQVFNILTQSYHLDNREQVKRAVDILTPAVPVRMDDGHQQMLSHIKKVLVEESHNLHHVQHVVQMVIRNYRVYFYIRHELMQPLIHAIQRIMHSPNGLVESLTARRLALEVCEMAIKWDLLRNRKLEQQTASRDTQENPEDVEVESVLEALKSSEKEDREKEGAEQSCSRTSVSTAQFTSTSRSDISLPGQSLSKEREEQVMRPLGKEHVDTIVNILLKFACSLPTANQPQQYASTTMEMSKRSLALLRAALKPVVWGETVTIKVQWIEKQLTIPADMMPHRQDTSGPAAQHMQQAQQTLDTIYALASVMPKSLLLQVVRPVQRAIISCLNSNYSVLVRTVNSLVGRLFEKTNSSITGLDELEIFNQYICKYLNDQFNNYHKSPSAVVQQVFTAFALLRAICQHQPGYLDAMCLHAFIKVLEKAVREHIGHVTTGQESTREKGVAELISIALELVRPRVDAMGTDSRRAICQNVLLHLIEKTNYDKVVENLLKITQELVVTHKDEMSANPGLPLTVRLHVLMDKKYKSNSHLMSLYLQLVLTVFETPRFRFSEYGERMEEAFYWGLTTSDPPVREKFLRLWERDMDRLVLRRLLLMLRDQNWTGFRDHFWLRHAIWLCMQCLPDDQTDSKGKRIYFADTATLWRSFEATGGLRDNMPSLGAVTMGSDQSSRSTPSGGHEHEPMDIAAAASRLALAELSSEQQSADELLLEQRSLLADAAAFDMSSTIDAVTGIIFNVSDTKFVAAIWTRLFNSLWADMGTEEREQFAVLLEPFLSSGVHNPQIGSPHSVLNTWLDTLNKAHPPVHLPPRLIQFVASRHQAWHLGSSMLESQVMMLNSRMLNNDSAMQKHVDANTQMHLDALDYLGELYKELSELDQYAAIWSRRAIKQDTLDVINKMQMGEVTSAFHLVEKSLLTAGEQLSLPSGESRIGPALDEEIRLLFDTYAVCCEELSEWEKLRDLANSPQMQSPRLLMAAGMHLPDWTIVQECRDQMAGCIPPNFLNQFTIYNAMLTVMQPSDPSDPLALSSKNRMEKALEDATQAHVTYWRTLPSIVCNAHVKVLQAMNLVREVADCVDMKTALDASGSSFNGSILNEMKSIIKIWSPRNRYPAVSDDLSFISSMYNWRCQVHAMVVRKFDEWETNGQVSLPPGSTSQSILPIHSAAQGQVHLAKAARNMHLYDLAVDQLNRLNTLTTVPMMDSHQKICEHLKVLRTKAEHPGLDPKERTETLHLGLYLIDDTNISEFSKEQTCKLFTVKGTFLSLLEKREEALRAFSTAAQLSEASASQQQYQQSPSSTASNTVFRAWGNHMDRMFQNDKSSVTGLVAGSGAIGCFLETARHESEPKARKYIGKILWTSKNMVACGPVQRLDELFTSHAEALVPFNWLSWLPQIVSEIQFRPTSAIVKILHKIGVAYPMQVFYTLRSAMPLAVVSRVIESVTNGTPGSPPNSSDLPWILSLLPVLQSVCEARPSDIRMFHRFLCELDELREFWVERQLRFATQMKDEIFRCLHQSSSTMDVGRPFEQSQLDQSGLFVLGCWKDDVIRGSKERLVEEKTVDPSKHNNEQEFIREISSEIISTLSSPPPPGQLVRFMESVMKINHKLHRRFSKLPRRLPLKSLSDFLPSFNHRQACIEMPSDLLNVLRNGQYVSMISRVEPFVDMSIQGGQPVRKVHIRAHTGKTCTFFIRRSVHRGEGIDRCQQFLSNLNTLFAKQKETCRRHLSVYVPLQLVSGIHSSLIETSTASAVTSPDAAMAGRIVMHPMEMLSSALLPVGMRPDDVIAMFYDRMQSEGGGVDVRARLFRDLTMEELVSPSILIRYLMQHFPNPTHFYMLRKQVARQLAVFGIVEWLVRLTPMALADFYIHPTTGQLANPNYAFDLEHCDVERPVPFRLTPNLNVFLGFAIDGDLQWSAISAARCLLFSKPEVILRPLFWDHVVSRCTRSPKELFNIVNNFINRFLANTEVTCSTTPSDPVPYLADPAHIPNDVIGLLLRARHEDNLCRLDPALHPWF